MTIFKENIVDTNLIGPILTALLAAAGFYCKFWFTRYQASRDQAQKVSRAIEDVLSKMAALFGQKKPARILREEFSAVIAPLHQEMRILDDMTSRLPLKWLQREQRHVLYHARWLQRYLDSRRAAVTGTFSCYCTMWRWGPIIRLLTFWHCSMTVSSVVDHSCRLT